MSGAIDPRDPFGLLGQVLDGQFRIDAVVGEGGFSIVYRGVHLGLGEPIAIKCLKLQAQLGSALVESFIRRFRDEGRILYRLSQGHLHIVRSIASGTTIAPATSAIVPYTVLEWLEGGSLAFDFEQRRLGGKRGRSLVDVMKLIDSAVDAVAYAHAQGVVHRDLNPGNIFLAKTREGVKAKVLDFGVAKVVSDHAMELGPRAATFGQIRIFSPAYAAPEQFDDKLGKVAPWTDVYTLAIVLLEGLRDQSPVMAETLGEIIKMTLDANARPTPRALGVDVSNAVEAVFAQALSVDPAARFHDAGEFWGALKNALQQPSTGGVALARVAALAALAPAGGTPPPPDAGPAVNKTLPLNDPRYMAARAAAVEHANQLPSPAPAAPAQLEASSPWPVSDASARATMPTALPSDVVTRNKMVAIFVGAGAAVMLLAGIVILYVLTRSPTAPVTSSEPSSVPAKGAAPVGSPAAPAAPPHTSTLEETTPPSDNVVTMPAATVKPTSSATPPPSAAATAVSTAAATSTATSSPASTATARAKATATAPLDPNAFNPAVAQAKLGILDGILASCKKSELKATDGVAHVTFANDGSVTAINVSGPVAGTPDADCVASRYKSAKVPPFETGTGVVAHPFKLPK